MCVRAEMETERRSVVAAGGRLWEYCVVRDEQDCAFMHCPQVFLEPASPGADVAWGEPSPGADVAWGEPSPGADVAGVSPVPVQMWHGVSPVPVQMWPG